jgi:hypothetical protein
VEPVHVWSLPQVMPQSPHACGVFCVVVHRSSAVQLWALHWQALFWQIPPWRQGMLHPPQLSTSLVTSVQTPLQSWAVAGQVQFPPLHTSPAGQALVQVPQCALSLLRSTQPTPAQ